MDEDRYLAISLLSQADYCLRRAVLIENERIWEESEDTAAGRIEHERVHEHRVERRGGNVKLYEHTVFSHSLGLNGKCDCIEATRDDAGCTIPAADFPVKLYPIEYKHGKVRSEREYEIQLCAQAMCLEEMYGADIRRGALLYITSHRRLEVEFTDELRQAAIDTLDKLRKALMQRTVPPAEYSSRCKRCSIKDNCMPELRRSADEYCRALRAEAMRMP